MKFVTALKSATAFLIALVAALVAEIVEAVMVACRHQRKEGAHRWHDSDNFDGHEGITAEGIGLTEEPTAIGVRHAAWTIPAGAA